MKNEKEWRSAAAALGSLLLACSSQPVLSGTAETSSAPEETSPAQLDSAAAGRSAALQPLERYASSDQLAARGEAGFRRDGGRFRASSRAHGLEFEFDARGVELRPREGQEGTLRVGGLAIQRGSSIESLVAAEPALGDCGGAASNTGACTERLEAARGDVIERWESRPEGLEHSFIVKRARAGTAPLSLLVGVEGARVEVEQGGQSARLIPEHGRVLRYSDLRAWDANGTRLPARMEGAPGGLALLVEDATARYPVTIDPLISGALWHLSLPQYLENDFRHDISSAAGDVNGDGFPDLVLSSPFAGENDDPPTSRGQAFVYYGSAHGFASSPDWLVEDIQGFGFALASADMNGDGFDDVIVAHHSLPNSAAAGRLSLYLGGSTGLATTPAATFTTQANVYNLARAGDVDGDGFEDLIGSLSNASAAPTRVTVYRGAASGFGPVRALTPSAPASRFGQTVASAGDVNGDGFSDVLVGEPGFDNGQVDEGRVHLFLGSASGIATTAAWTAEANNTGAALGSSLTSAGDVNGDGFDDVLVGAPGYADHGRAFLYLGSRSGLGSASAWAPSPTNGGFGSGVFALGDVNGDGRDDVAISSLQPHSALSVYNGTPSGASTSLAFKRESDVRRIPAFAIRGGDLNRDGFADLMMLQLPDFPFDPADLWVFAGSSAGIVSAP